jgi:hypothetical protein
MKKISLALSSALMLLVALSSTANAVEPWAAGIKVNGLTRSLTNLDKATKPFAKPTTSMLNLGLLASAYGEYAFHDNVGAGLEAGFGFGQVGKLSNEKDQKSKPYSISMQNITVSPYVKFYPLGREDENGILYTSIKANWLVTLAVEGKQEESKTEDKAQDKDIALGSFGAGLNAGWEFPFGLFTEVVFNYAFMGPLKKDQEFQKTKLGLNEEVQLWDGGVALGYNFAALFEE